MKTKVVSPLAVVALILGFAFIDSAPAAPNASARRVIPTATSRAGDTTASPAEPHPQIREALGALRRAKEHMEHSAHDFGGHRVEALRATDEAIRQLEICLKYDKE